MHSRERNPFNLDQGTGNTSASLNTTYTTGLTPLGAVDHAGLLAYFPDQTVDLELSCNTDSTQPPHPKPTLTTDYSECCYDISGRTGCIDLW